ncbi:MAG: tRNA pseudouridine(38-40) synthase TruA [Nitrospirota bacterium]
MRTVRLTLQYDGTRYQGWQVQRTGVTIQGLVQEALAATTGERVTVIAAGRTDAGVHALEQVAAFRSAAPLAPEVFTAALNARLPEDVRVMESRIEREDFHPRFNAKGKVYAYLIAHERVLSPFLHRYAWRVTAGLDLEAMGQALAVLKGTHDFSSFRASGCGARNPVRTITAVSLARHDRLEFMTMALRGDFMTIRIEGDAFLRHMVRNIVGTVVEVGKGRLSIADMENILLARKRPLAGPAAPARGLFLERVLYP